MRMTKGTARAAATALVGLAAAGAPAGAGIMFTGNAAFTKGGNPTVVAGAGNFADTTNLVNTANGLALSNGTWTYTSAAADVNNLVKLNFAAQRDFKYTAGNNYFTTSTIDITAAGPMGIKGDFGLNASWAFQAGVVNTLSDVDPAFTLAGAANNVAVKKSADSPLFNMAAAGNDLLLVEAQLEFTPTAANQKFVFTFPNSAEGDTAQLGAQAAPEPSTLALAGAGGLALLARRRRRRRA